MGIDVGRSERVLGILLFHKIVFVTIIGCLCQIADSQKMDNKIIPCVFIHVKTAPIKKHHKFWQ